MISSLRQKFGAIFLKDFNLCLFISFCLLAIYHRATESIVINRANILFHYLYIPAFNGFFTALTILVLNRIFNKKKFTKPYYSDEKLKLSIVAFIAGFFSYYISFSVIAVYAITVLIVVLFVAEFKIFTGKLSALLSPNKLASTNDISSFVTFFINLIITFTIINLSVNHIHNDLGFEKAFNFQRGILGIIDALYFNIITMTTVGFGDIVPLNAVGRILISIECIISYLMFGILIGIITRGVKLNRRNNH